MHLYPNKYEVTTFAIIPQGKNPTTYSNNI